MSALRALALLMLVLSGLLVTRLAGPAWRVARITLGVRRRRQHDASDGAPIPPPAVAARLDELAGLGFRRIGETFVDLPDVGRRFAWQAADVDGGTYASVVPNRSIGALTGLYTAWPDGTWLSTMDPLGETIDDGRLVVQAVAGPAEAAVAAHAARRSALVRQHGDPRRVATVVDVLALDDVYRSHYGGRTLVRRTGRIVVPAVLAAALLVTALVLLALTAR